MNKPRTEIETPGSLAPYDRVVANMARLSFVAACEAAGTDPIVEENAALSIGREFLPPFAIAVLDKTGEASGEYWAWLIESVETAQAEHDREIAAGQEWWTE